MLIQVPRIVALAAFAALACALPVAAHHPGDDPTMAVTSVGGAEATLSGTIEELVVVDQVNASTQRYPILRQGDGSRVPLRGDAIQSLTTGSQVSVLGNRTGVSFTVDHVVSAAPTTKSAQVARLSTTQVDGRFMVAHHDNFETGSSQFLYHVFNTQGGVTELAMPFLPGSLATGMEVNVEGTIADDGVSVVPNQIVIQSIPSVLEATTTTNYLVIPIKFPTNAAAPWTYNADPFTPAALNTAVFGSLPTKSVKEYYKEASYGQQLLSGAVADNGAGGFLLANVAKPATCDISAIATAAENAAKARGYNVAGYTGILYVFNNISGCGWSGLAYVGWARAYSNNSTNLLVIAHELGHNFGLLHAGSLRCTGTPIGCGATGSVSEYGDPFSTMGNINAGHFNAAQKDILGWFAPSQVKTHAGGTTTYTLSPIETGGLPAYAVKIPTTNANRTYWLEYRQPVGTFDTFITGANYPNNGVQVRIEYPFEKTSGSDDTEILDMTPATGSFGDAALLVGAAPFVDPSTNVSINVVSATPGANGQILVQVSTSVGTPTTTTLTSSNNPSNPGSNVTFTATVTGVAPTGTVNFTNGGASIAGCAAAALVGSGNVRTATCATTALAAGPHSIVANYSGDAGNTGSASAALSQVVKATSSTVLGSSGTPSAFGASVTFTASVTGVAPTGTVNFKDGATSIAGCAAVALAGSGNTRTATCTTSTLTAGTHSMTAAYGGDAGNVASTSSVFSQVVNASAVATTTTRCHVADAVDRRRERHLHRHRDRFGTHRHRQLQGRRDVDRRLRRRGAGRQRQHPHRHVCHGSACRRHPQHHRRLLRQRRQPRFDQRRTVASGEGDVVHRSWQFRDAVRVRRQRHVHRLGHRRGTHRHHQLQGRRDVDRRLRRRGAGRQRQHPHRHVHHVHAHRRHAQHDCRLWRRCRQRRVDQQRAVPGRRSQRRRHDDDACQSADPSIVGAGVTFTATVTGSAPTGTVNFKDGATSIAGCSAVALAGSGTAAAATPQRPRPSARRRHAQHDRGLWRRCRQRRLDQQRAFAGRQCERGRHDDDACHVADAVDRRRRASPSPPP